MNIKCPVCSKTIDKRASICPECGAYIKENDYQENEVLEAEVVDNEVETTGPTPLNQSLLQQIYGGLTPQKQKLFGLARAMPNKKLVIGATVTFYIAPLASIMTAYGIYQCIYILLHYNEYLQLIETLPPGILQKKSKSDLWKNMAFNFAFLLISLLAAYYVWFWVKQN